MEKNNTNKNQSPKWKTVRAQGPVTIGMDLGDKTSRCCVLDEAGLVRSEESVATNRDALVKKFKGLRPCRIAIEVGTHSPWISRLLHGLGHEVIVANARQVQLISKSTRKNDRMDAQTLARLARVDPKLLRPVHHRSEDAQMHLMKIRVRAALVDQRTGLINAARGLAKSVGERLSDCDADYIGVEQLESLPKTLKETLLPLLKQVESLTAAIKAVEHELEQIARKDYPEAKLLEQIKGVGTLIALTFLLTVDDAERFRRSRDIGCYVGLRPKQSESGEKNPQLSITKEGDRYLRKLLVQGAQYILRRSSPDTDLKRWGLKLASRGGKNAKKRAVIAVARKLSILLHRLWVTGEVYEPLRNSTVKAAVAA